VKAAAASIATGWQPDPFGEHEFRLFSPEGSATAHVCNEGRHSYDEMPGAVVVDPPRDHTSRVPAPSAARHHAAWRGNLRERAGHVGAHVRVHHLALLDTALVLLTTRDRKRPLRLVVPAFSTIFVAVMSEASARRDSVERSRPGQRATPGTS
jgi:hypothetical protein